MSKDDRMFIPIKSKQTQNQIRTVMKASGLTYEQLIEKYLKMPYAGDLELLANKHKDTKKLYEEYVCEANQHCAHELFEYIWVILAQTALGGCDSKKIIKHITNHIDNGDFITDSYEGD